MRRIMFFSFLFFLASSVAAVPGNATKIIYDADVTGDYQTLISMGNSYLEENNRAEAIPCYTTALHILLRSKEKNEDTVDQVYKIAKNAYNELAKTEKREWLLGILQSDLLSIEITFSPMKFVTIGGKIKSISAQTYNLEPNNPMAIMLRASTLMYLPAMIGGDKDEAMRLLKKGVSIYEKANETHENRIYNSLLISLMNGYAKIGDKQNSSATYKKIIEIEPRYKSHLVQPK